MGAGISNRSNTPILAASSPNGQQLLEQTTRIDRLLKEIDALRETNKNLAEQNQVRQRKFSFDFDLDFVVGVFHFK